MQRLRLPTAPNRLAAPVALAALCGACLVTLSVSGCAAGRQWVGEPDQNISDESGSGKLVDDRDRQENQGKDAGAVTIGREDEPLKDAVMADAPGDRPVIRLKGRKKPADGPLDGKLVGVFRNTYYDFPTETDFTGPATPLMNAQCKEIRAVPRGFYDAVCVQGSGTLATGSTVSFAKRNCRCARTCERTDQKICFDELDRKQFPWGRGAMGKPITPLRSVAVDSDVIPLGTPIYILEFDGVPRKPGGTPHDGCFVAEDRGMKVVGEHVDVFTGNARVTQHFNSLVPSNAGVHVYVGTARCH